MVPLSCCNWWSPNSYQPWHSPLPTFDLIHPQTPTYLPPQTNISLHRSVNKASFIQFPSTFTNQWTKPDCSKLCRPPSTIYTQPFNISSPDPFQVSLHIIMPPCHPVLYLPLSISRQILCSSTVWNVSNIHQILESFPKWLPCRPSAFPLVLSLIAAIRASARLVKTSIGRPMPRMALRCRSSCFVSSQPSRLRLLSSVFSLNLALQAAANRFNIVSNLSSLPPLLPRPPSRPSSFQALRPSSFFPPYSSGPTLHHNSRFHLVSTTQLMHPVLPISSPRSNCLSSLASYKALTLPRSRLSGLPSKPRIQILAPRHPRRSPTALISCLLS